MMEDAEAIVPEETALPEVGRRWRESDARVLVEAWRRSGQSIWRFAQQHGMGGQRLRYWVVRLTQAQESEPVPLQFHPVHIVEGRAASPSEQRIEVVLAAGHSVLVPSGFAADDLARVLDVLAGHPC
jgi:hypothetical protein